MDGRRIHSLRCTMTNSPDEAPPKQPPQDMLALLRDPPKAAPSCPGGTSLWLLGHGLNDECADVFARSLLDGDWSHLTYLNLGTNEIRVDGMAAIAGAFGEGRAPLLANLNVSENRIGDAGAAALAASLRAMPALTSIESGKCGFGDDGMSALMQAAKAGGTPCMR